MKKFLILGMVLLCNMAYAQEEVFYSDLPLPLVAISLEDGDYLVSLAENHTHISNDYSDIANRKDYEADPEFWFNTYPTTLILNKDDFHCRVFADMKGDYVSNNLIFEAKAIECAGDGGAKLPIKGRAIVSAIPKHVNGYTELYFPEDSFYIDLVKKN